jgi:hypothetical protein
MILCSCLKMATTDWVRIPPFRYGSLEVHSPGNLPFRTNLRLLLLYSPLYKSYFQWGDGSSG